MAAPKQALETGDSADLCRALMAMLSRGIELDAAAELLICSNFDPDVAEQPGAKARRVGVTVEYRTR
ncbi:MAG: hypothetical protein HQ453_11415 [Actinobacteria bacterium]|nr:hypothetical protein [Actinomycetota bacterium]